MGYYVKGKAIETGIPLRGHIPDDPVVLATLAELELRASAEPFAFIWLGLLQPSKLEMAQVGEVFGLDHLLMEDSLNPHQRAKMDIRPDHLMVVFKVISYIEETSAVETGQITAFVGPHSVVTVRLGPVGDLGDIRAGLEARPDLMRHGPQAVVYALFDGIVDGYLEVTDELTQDIEQLEEQVFSPTSALTAAPASRSARSARSIRRKMCRRTSRSSSRITRTSSTRTRRRDVRASNRVSAPTRRPRSQSAGGVRIGRIPAVWR